MSYCVPALDQKQVALLCEYVQDKANMPTPFNPSDCSGFAVLNSDNDFIGAVVISNYRKVDCEISCACDNSFAWSDGVIKAVFTYIFIQLGCVRCTSITTRGNKKARGFLDHLGFKLEGVARKAYDGRRDALIYGYLREECQWVEPAEPDDEPVEDEEEPEPAPLPPSVH